MPTRRTFLWICIALLAMNLAPGRAAEPPEAIELSNGVDLTGWVAEGTAKTRAGAPVWTVSDGMILCAGQGYGFLRYDRPFTDFALSLEFRLEEKTNSGLGIRHAKYTGERRSRPSFSGYEIQLIDDPGQPPSTHSSGSLYRYVAPQTRALKAAGEWNLMQVTCRGSQITVTLNGAVIHDLDQKGVAEIAEKPLSGYVSLQNHGGRVAFRNLRVEVIAAPRPPLPPAAPLPAPAVPMAAGRAVRLIDRPKELPTRQRGDTPTGRLLDRLEELNAGNERFNDAWLQTLKSIVDLGDEAVPELIAELDATDDNMMMRCMGFTLRAIEDPRAVPALIRAIPKTLLPAGSDMGLRATQPELAAFAQANDLDESHQGNEYGFGRPVREICGALHKFGRRQLGEEELFHVFVEGTPAQQRMKRKLFYDVARRWADWWEEKGGKLVPDAAYHAVNLPPLALADAAAPSLDAIYKTSGGHSGWILESFDAPGARIVFYDCDTGRAAGLPERWREPNADGAAPAPTVNEVAAWAAEAGYDLMGVPFEGAQGRRRYAIKPLQLQAWELGEDRWKMSSDAVTIAELQQEAEPAKELLLHVDRQSGQYDPEATASFLFITRDGTPGLLFVGIEVQDDSLQPGGVMDGDTELEPVGFHKGRRFGLKCFEPVEQESPAP